MFVFYGSCDHRDLHLLTHAFLTRRSSDPDVRICVEPGAGLLLRASASAVLYRDAGFNDVTIGVQAGPQYAWGRSQLTFSFGPSWRWYGRDPYSRAVGGSVSWQRPTGKRSQMRIEGGIVHQTNLRNVLQTADDFTLSDRKRTRLNSRH